MDVDLNFHPGLCIWPAVHMILCMFNGELHKGKIIIFKIKCVCASLHTHTHVHTITREHQPEARVYPRIGICISLTLLIVSIKSPQAHGFLSVLFSEPEKAD